MFDVQKFVAEVQDYIARALSPLAERVKELEARQPERGEPGRDGADGKSVTVDEVKPVIVELVKEVVAEIPQPKDGEPGKDGQDGKDGKDGKDGEPGKDGQSFTIEDAEKLLDAKMARWELDFERRANDALQKAVDRMPQPKDGKDGKDGLDGIGFDDLDVQFDGERKVSLVFTKGDRIKQFEFSLPVQIDRGVYSQDACYERGDSVTWGGSIWVAQKDAPTGKPGEPGSDGWRLAVKRGRDGKDGRDGIDRTASVSLGGK